MKDTETQTLMLVASGISRRFGSARALADANLEVRSGEVHGLLGANGAGKSTLSRVICGHVSRDGGTILYKGAPLPVRSTRDTLRSGVALVAQETCLAPDLSVLENIFMPEFGRSGWLSFSRMRRRALELLDRLGGEHGVGLDREVRRLSAAQRQLVEIAKALALDADLVVFDEPTSSLSPSEVDRLFDIMTRLKQEERGLIFVSHRLEEVFEITDRVTVLREGVSVACGLETMTLTQSDVIRHMVGKDLEPIQVRRTASESVPEGEILLEVERLAARPVVRDVSFFVRRGEVLGLGGLVGAGRSETVEALFGLRPRDSGTIRLNGKPVDPRTPAQAIRLGIGLVAEDRRGQNIVPDLTVGENLLLAHLGTHKGWGLGYSRRRRRMETLLARLGLPPDRLEANLLTFSGGMQQKVIIARWLLVEPEILILDEPTKGVDIATRGSIYGIVRELAKEGVAVIVISSDFEELLGVCERVTVISDGLSIADLAAEALTEEKLTLLAAPRTSAERTFRLLRALSHDYGASSFWALLDSDGLICLGAVSAPCAPRTGLTAGRAVRYGETAIASALVRREQAFVTEPGSGVSTLLVPRRNKRGHDLGWIGVSLAAGTPLPDREAILRKIADLTATEIPWGAP